MASVGLCVKFVNIKVHDYKTDPHKRLLADELLERYRLSADDVDEIVISDNGVVSFHVLERETKTWVWVDEH